MLFMDNWSKVFQKRGICGYIILTLHSNLPQALAQSEILRKKNKEWPPVNSGVHKQAKGLAGVIDDELGYLD